MVAPQHPRLSGPRFPSEVAGAIDILSRRPYAELVDVLEVLGKQLSGYDPEDQLDRALDAIRADLEDESEREQAFFARVNGA